MTTLANVRVNFVADTTQVEKSVSRVSAGMKAAGAAAAGLASSVALGAVVNQAVNAGSAIYDMSQRSGLSAEFLSSMKMAAEQAGGSLSDVTSAFKRLNKAAETAATGKGSPFFKELGIDAQAFVKLSADQKMIQIAEALSKVEDNGRRAFLIQKLMGEGGLRLTEIWKGGAAGMAEIAKQAAASNQVITTAQAANADELGDKLDTLRAKWEGFKTQLGLNLAEPLIRELDQIMRLADHVAGAVNGLFTALNVAGNVAGHFGAVMRASLTGGFSGGMQAFAAGNAPGDVFSDLFRDPTKDGERAAALEEQRKTNELLKQNNRLTGEMAGVWRFGVPAVAQ